MERTCDAFADALRSGESDRVNSAIDEVREMGPADRVELLDDCFEECLGVYEEGDGYQRQSVVRFLDRLNPRLEMLELMSEEDRERIDEHVPPERRHEYTDRLREFFVDALQDDDGRVRRAATRGLKDVASVTTERATRSRSDRCTVGSTSWPKSTRTIGAITS